MVVVVEVVVVGMTTADVFDAWVLFVGRLIVVAT